MAAAERLLSQVKTKGFRDAFIVFFKNDARITKEEALSTPGIK